MTTTTTGAEIKSVTDDNSEEERRNKYDEWNQEASRKGVGEEFDNEGNGEK